MRYSQQLRNARLNQVASAIGAGGMLRIFSSDLPARTEASDPPGVIAEIELPEAPFRDADGGVLQITESWTGHGARDAGKGTLARSFRLYDALGECHIEGTVTAHEDGGDLRLDNPSIAAGQKIAIGGFTFRERESS